jgi:DNA-binding response OmpR family regulator
MPSILIADSDLRICDFLEKTLKKASYQVYVANDGVRVLEVLSEVRIDILVLDDMIPKLNGLQTARQVCKRFSTPILMLTAMDNEASRIKSFEAGADQHLLKPFSGTELSIRIKSMLRRVSLERTRYKHTIPDDEFEQAICLLPFTSTESELVNYLMLCKGKIVSKKELQINVLRRDFCEFDRNLDMHISNIRKKLIQSGFSKNVILTIRNKGFIFEEHDESALMNGASHRSRITGKHY